MAKTVLICSGKGGVGKSTITAMLGIELSNLNKKVLVFDYDIGLRNIDILLGVQNAFVYNVVDYLNGTIALDDVILQHPNHSNLFFLPTSQYAKQKHLDEKQLKKLLLLLKEKFDYILIDSPAGIEKYVKNALKLVDNTIIITTANTVAMRAAEKVLFEIRKFQLPTPQLIVNQVVKKYVRRGIQYSPQTVSTILDIPLLGFFYNDEAVQLALQNETLPNRTSSMARSANAMARRLLGENMPTEEIKKGFFDFFKFK